MLENYFKTAFRSLIREKANTVINVAGLALGITSCIILFLILKDGVSYDVHHKNYNRIFRVVSQGVDNGRESFSQGIPTALPDAFKNDFTQAEEVVFTSYRRNSTIAVEQADGKFKKFEEPKGVVITEPSFFRVFDRKMLVGDAAKGLDEPNEAIISAKWAQRYFGNTEAVGIVIRYDANDYKINGVMEDYPPTTDFPFDLMLSYSTVKKLLDEKGWGNVADIDNCYFLLKENESVEKIAEQMPGFVNKYLGSSDGTPVQRTYLLQPLKEIHTDMRFGNYNKKMPPAAKISFTVIGVFLVLMACINFINLTTAEAVKRTKEVGIRKALGSSQLQLIGKFVGETFLVTCIAVLIALGLTELALTYVNSFMDMSLSLAFDNDYRVWIFLITITVGVSVISGLYPAIVISRFRPALVLKGQLNVKNSSGFNLRRSLVVLQFFISQLFIICTIVVSRQMNFMEGQDLGFKKDAIVTIPIPVQEEPSPTSRMRSLKNEILRLPGVEKASLNSSPPSSSGVMNTGFKIIEKGDELNTQVKQVDGDYLDLFEIELLAGEKLADSDTMTGFVVNEKFVQNAGYDIESILGKELDFWGKRLPVKGVVKDYSTRSLSKPMEPVVMLNNKNGFGSLSIKLKPGDSQASITQIQKLWESAYPEHIFKFEFLDEHISNMYRGERKMAVLVTVFAVVAVFIGCLGLFGLISFMANQKSKEVGIRKVLGASVESIMFLFSKEFVKLILIGFVLAAPLGAVVMNLLLQEFAYRIDLGPAIFLSALGVTFFIALGTVGLRSFRAASANPVRSLRSE
jgi:putative ABC transport system permease protein